jgi:hypothetical protein
VIALTTRSSTRASSEDQDPYRAKNVEQAEFVAGEFRGVVGGLQDIEHLGLSMTLLFGSRRAEALVLGGNDSRDEVHDRHRVRGGMDQLDELSDSLVPASEVVVSPLGDEHPTPGICGGGRNSHEVVRFRQFRFDEMTGILMKSSTACGQRVCVTT